MTKRTLLPASPSPVEDQNLTREIDINRIRVGEDRRPADGAFVAELIASVQVTGQINPIVVRPIIGNSKYEWSLVAGLNRLQALTTAGHKTILARILPLDDERAMLWQIDENLVRRDLSPAQTDIALAERRAIYNRSHDDKARAAHAANKAMGRRHDANDALAPAFTEQLADLTGSSRRSIERSVARAAAIGKDQLNLVVRTSLDRPSELDALAKLDVSERRDLIQRASAGEKVSAARHLKEKAEETEPSIDRLQAAWDGTPVDQQDTFLARNDLMRRSVSCS